MTAPQRPDPTALFPDVVAAIERGDATELERLLRAGADPNWIGRGGDSLLHMAHDAATAAILLAAGADPRMRDDDGHDAIDEQLFWINVGEGSPADLEAARVMIQHLGGAQAWDPRGEALWYAVFNRNPEIVALLLECGADPTHSTWGRYAGEGEAAGDTLMHVIASDGGPLDADEDRRIRRIVELLIAAGCPLEVANATGRTPLHAAVDCLYADAVTTAVELLLSHGVACDPADHRGVTPLMLAADLREVECARMLLAAGADPVRKCKAGRTAIDRALAALALVREQPGTWSAADVSRAEENLLLLERAAGERHRE